MTTTVPQLLYYAYRFVALVLGGFAFLIAGAPGHAQLTTVAHTGYCTQHLENTEQAFIGAAENGCQGIETDIRFTSDEIPITWHDGYVNFTDGTSLLVGEATLKELQEKPIQNNINDEVCYIGTLEHYFEICKQYHMVCFLDIKSELTPARVQAIMGLAEQVYDLDMVIPQSSDVDNLIEIRRQYPDLQIMLTYGRNQFERELDYTVCFDYNFGIDCDYTVLSKKMIGQFREHKLPVAVFTCNTVLQKNYALYLGVDYMETDECEVGFGIFAK